LRIVQHEGASTLNGAPITKSPPQIEAPMSQQKVEREKVPDTSGDLLEAQITKLRTAYPEVVVEGEKDDAITQSQGLRAVHQIGTACAHHRY
jgi:hypothetical protein